MDWADPKAVAVYCAKLPVVKLLGPRLRQRYEARAVFAEDYLWLVSQVYSEWFGLFGFSGGQICPGIRVPFPKAVSDRAYHDAEFFCSLSDGFFQAFGGDFFTDGFVLPRDLGTRSAFLSPALGFFRSVRFSQLQRDGRLYLRASMGLETRYYGFDSARRTWALESEPLGQWTGLKEANLLYLFFPYEGRFLWGPSASQFFTRFSFSVINKGDFIL